MKTVTVLMSNGDALGANIFKDGNVTLACLDDTLTPNWVVDQLPRAELVAALRDLADQIEKAVP